TTRPARAEARAGRVGGRRAPARYVRSTDDLVERVRPLPVVGRCRRRLPVLDRVVVPGVADVQVLATLRPDNLTGLEVRRAVAGDVRELLLDGRPRHVVQVLVGADRVLGVL